MHGVKSWLWLLLVAAIAPGGVLFAIGWLLRGRCSATLWLASHDAMFARGRDAAGEAKPYVIAWECRRCGRPCGVTALPPSWGLLARLRRQVTARRRSNAA